MRDDIDFNVQFCELVEQYPALYDYTKPEYSNRNVQDKIWMEIGLKLGESGKLSFINLNNLNIMSILKWNWRSSCYVCGKIFSDDIWIFH